MNAFEIGGGYAGPCAVSAGDQAPFRHGPREGLSQSGLRHCPCQDKRVAAYHPQELQMTKAVAEALRIIEVRTKIQLLTFEAESTEVIPFPSKDPQTIGKSVESIEDDGRPSRRFDQFGQGVSIGAHAVGAEVQPHGLQVLTD